MIQTPKPWSTGWVGLLGSKVNSLWVYLARSGGIFVHGAKVGVGPGVVVHRL